MRGSLTCGCVTFLVAGLARRYRRLSAAIGRLVERGGGIRNLKGDDADAIAVPMNELCREVIGTQRRREYESDIALLEQIGGRVSGTGLETAICGPVETEARLVEHGGLPGVADEELEMVDPFNRTEVGHNATIFAAKRRIVQQKLL